MGLIQNILIKNTIGLSKYVRTTPLFTALRIKSIQHLVYQHKLSFVNQLNAFFISEYTFKNKLNLFQNSKQESNQGVSYVFIF